MLGSQSTLFSCNHIFFGIKPAIIKCRINKRFHIDLRDNIINVKAEK